MSSINAIPPDNLFRLIGVPHGQAIVDMRSETDFSADPRLIPGAIVLGADTAQLEAGMTLYDAFYLWRCDTMAETHN